MWPLLKTAFAFTVATSLANYCTIVIATTRSTDKNATSPSSSSSPAKTRKSTRWGSGGSRSRNATWSLSSYSSSSSHRRTISRSRDPGGMSKGGSASRDAINVVDTIEKPAEINDQLVTSAATYYAEDYAATHGCTLEDKSMGYSSPSGYMNCGGSQSWIQWDGVHGEKAGEYNLTVRYAVGGDDEGRRCELFVGGESVGILRFDRTGEWTAWAYESKVISLRKGYNSIKFMSLAGGPNLDLLRVEMATAADGTIPPPSSNTNTDTTEESSGLSPCLGEASYFIFELVTDVFASETFWSLKEDAAEKEISFGGPYEDGTRHSFKYDICIHPGRFTFTINDTQGDGICCRYGNGYYVLTLDGIVQKVGGIFGGGESTELEVMRKTSLLGPSQITDTPTLAPSSQPTLPMTLKPTSRPTLGFSYPPTGPPSLPPPTLEPSPVQSSVPTYISATSPSNRPGTALTPAPGSDFDSCRYDAGGKTYFELDLSTDLYGTETWWILKNDATGLEVASGGPYSYQPNRYEYSLCLEPGRYEFTIFDSEGDGICCQYGNGKYIVKLDGAVIKVGSTFTDQDSTQLTISTPVPTRYPTMAPTTMAPTTPPPSQLPTAFTAVYEAEDYTAQNGCIQDADNTGYSGVGYMNYGSAGSFIEWGNVYIPRTGLYRLSIAYAAGDEGGRASRLFLQQKKKSSIVLSFASTGGWDLWGSEVIVVPLIQGDNTVRIEAINDGPNIDYMLVDFDSAIDYSVSALTPRPSSLQQKPTTDPTKLRVVNPNFVPVKNPSTSPSGRPTKNPASEPSQGATVRPTAATSSTSSFSSTFRGFFPSPSSTEINKAPLFSEFNNEDAVSKDPSHPAGEFVASRTDATCRNAGGTYVEIQILTDNFGSETTWILTNEDKGVIVASGGEYPKFVRQQYSYSECLEPGRYNFTIIDSEGDGICCAYGFGEYAISLDNIARGIGGSFGQSESTLFVVKDKVLTTPTLAPAMSSAKPSEPHSMVPSSKRSSSSSGGPSLRPSATTSTTTHTPSLRPTRPPSGSPSSEPTHLPSPKPSHMPTMVSFKQDHNPSSAPSVSPTTLPTDEKSLGPSKDPSRKPSAKPTPYRSLSPSTDPSTMSSTNPTPYTSSLPSPNPSTMPSTKPTPYPSSSLSHDATLSPSIVPSKRPTKHPTQVPSSSPTTYQFTDLPTQFDPKIHCANTFRDAKECGGKGKVSKACCIGLICDPNSNMCVSPEPTRFPTRGPTRGPTTVWPSMSASFGATFRDTFPLTSLEPESGVRLPKFSDSQQGRTFSSTTNANGPSSTNPTSAAPTKSGVIFEDLAEACARSGRVYFQLTLLSDQYGSETSWRLVNEDNGVIAASGGGEPRLSAKMYTYDKCISPAQYTFTINGEYGVGEYSVKLNGIVKIKGGNFAQSESTKLTVTAATTQGLTAFQTPRPTPAFLSTTNVMAVESVESAACSGNGGTRFELVLLTDDYGSETSWSLMDEDTGNLVASGGGYPQGLRQQYSYSQCLGPGYYVFSMFDSGGDGICCEYGLGEYAVAIDGIPIAIGGSFGETEAVQLFAAMKTRSPTVSPTFSAPTQVPTSSPTQAPTETPSSRPTPWPTWFDPKKQCAKAFKQAKECGGKGKVSKKCCDGLVCSKDSSMCVSKDPTNTPTSSPKKKDPTASATPSPSASSTSDATLRGTFN